VKSNLSKVFLSMKNYERNFKISNRRKLLVRFKFNGNTDKKRYKGNKMRQLL